MRRPEPVAERAWAIIRETDWETVPVGFLGVYYFENERGPAQTGMPWGVFRTRREARERIKKHHIDKAKVIRVWIGLSAAE